MAEKAYPESKITRVNMFCLRQRDAYTKGANDVLEEIERLFVNGESWCTIGENIQRMIKYLKEEK